MPELGRWRPVLDRVRNALQQAGWPQLLLVSAVVGAGAAALLLWSQHRLTVSGVDTVEVMPRAVRITTTQPPPGPLVVHVAGAVTAPGLIEITDGSRVADAVAAAGGLTGDADSARVNLAEKLVDGARLYIPALGEATPPPPMPSGSPAGAASTPAQPVDVNTATVEQLDVLPGVGPATAAAIVAYRDAHGPFTSVESLAEVRGIGPAKMEALRPMVRV